MKTKKDTVLWRLQRENKGKSGICPKCGKEREMTVEHIIPVHFMLQLGLDDEAVNDVENFEMLCLLCNRFKGGQLDLANPKTVELLKKYVNKL